MAGTYSQIYIMLVFVVKRRENLIHPSWETDLYKYMTGIIKNKGHILFAINGMPDHIHILISMKPVCSLSDLVREIKKSSNEYINSNNFCKHKFHWQEGYGAFSYSHLALPTVIRYIENQKEHHKKKTFTAEYKAFLKEFGVEYKDEYLFEDFGGSTPSGSENL